MKRFVVLGLVLGFSLATTAIPAQTTEGDLVKATFCRGLRENHTPKETAEFFRPNETVYLSVEIKGRPRMGEVTAKFKFREAVIAETKLDVEEANKGQTFSKGYNTFVGFTLEHEIPLPVGELYTAEVAFNGKSLGTFPFKIEPPEGALTGRFLKATLAKGSDENHLPVNPSREFESMEKVYLVAVADIGVASWVEVMWKVNGKVISESKRRVTFSENQEKARFTFNLIPIGGWPAGNHEVSLQLNGKEVAKEAFTVKVGAPVAETTELEILSCHLHADDGQGEAGEEVTGFRSSDKVLHVKWRLTEKTLATVEALTKLKQSVRAHLVWARVDVKGRKPRELTTADAKINEDGVIISTMNTKTGLPAGNYRVDFVQKDKVLHSKPFEVK